MARAKRGSNRRARTKCAVARLRAREADTRRDWAEKVGTDLARRFDVIRVFTSQRCSACGHVAAENRTGQAFFACTARGLACNADVNAARNTAAGHATTARGGLPLGGPVNREPQLLPPSA